MPQEDGTTALHWAAEGANPDIVELLIRAGANVKAANRYGATPPGRCVNGNAATIEMLLAGATRMLRPGRRRSS
jgi:ankyrin repeat protein